MKMTKFEDAKSKCESQFDDEEAVAQCVAGERKNWRVMGATGEMENVDLSKETFDRIEASDGFRDEVEVRLKRVKNGEITMDEAVDKIDRRSGDIEVFLRRQGKSVAEVNAASELMGVVVEQELVDTIDELTKDVR